MFKKVIIGIDGAQGGRDAIALAKQLVDDDGQLLLAYVHNGHSRFAARRMTIEAHRAQTAAVIDEAVTHSGINRILEITAPQVGQGLHTLAEREGADLLVIGSTGHGLFDRVLVGHETSEALNGAPCAVAVATSGYEQNQRAMSEIGIAYEGSPESQNAVAFARLLADKFGSKLSALEVVVLATRSDAGLPAALSYRAEERLSNARDRIAELGGIESHAAVGDPSEELSAYSAGVDLLIVGSRDYGPLGRLVHSSTSKRLAQSARSPLLILTRSARRAQQHGQETAGVTGGSLARGHRGEI